MKKRCILDFVSAATLLSMIVLTVDIPFVRAFEWSSETQLTTDPSLDKKPSIMQALNGTIYVVWTSNRKGTTNYELYYKTSSNYGSTWSSDKRLTTDPYYDLDPSIMQAKNGTIWVVWSSNRNVNYDIFYKTSYKWSRDIPLTTDTHTDTSPSIMQASNGTIWVVWSSNRNGNSDIFYKTYTGSSWSTEKPLTSDSERDLCPSIMQTSNGTILVVWSSYRTDDSELWYKTFNGTAWSSDKRLTNDTKDDLNPSIAQDVYGTIWVVWQSNRAPGAGGEAEDDLYYKLYSDSGWSSDTQLTTNNATDWLSSIAQINDGKIWIVWTSNRNDTFGTTDNDIYYKTALVKIAGDVNGDRIVDAFDLHALGKAYGATPSSPNWNQNADINYDSVINKLDLEKISTNYGKSK